MTEGDAFLPFQRAKFKTKLPRGRRYTAGHMWLRQMEGDLWHVGLTRFAIRMLGEPVEVDFETSEGEWVETGHVVGWMEGFKAVTDLYTPMTGHFAGANVALATDIRAVYTSPYERGWLFGLRGEPGEECVDAEGYAGFLEGHIDKMLGEEGAS
jgi:glycine cleavage system H protein